MRSVLGVHWKDCCWSWNSNILATWCKELTHLKGPWGWERLKAGGEGDNRGWDGWMASPTQWTWVWVNTGSWWWTGRPGVLQFMGLQSLTQLSDWTELNWTITRQLTLEARNTKNVFFTIVTPRLEYIGSYTRKTLKQTLLNEKISACMTLCYILVKFAYSYTIFFCCCIIYHFKSGFYNKKGIALTLSYIKQLTSGKLLYNAGSPTRCSVMT